MASKQKRAALPRDPRGGGDRLLRSARPEVGQIESTPAGGVRTHGPAPPITLTKSVPATGGHQGTLESVMKELSTSLKQAMLGQAFF